MRYKIFELLAEENASASVEETDSERLGTRYSVVELHFEGQNNIFDSIDAAEEFMQGAGISSFGGHLKSGRYITILPIVSGL